MEIARKGSHWVETLKNQIHLMKLLQNSECLPHLKW